MSSSSFIALVLNKLSGAGRALALVLGTFLLLVRSALLRDVIPPPPPNLPIPSPTCLSLPPRLSESISLYSKIENKKKSLLLPRSLDARFVQV